METTKTAETKASAAGKEKSDCAPPKCKTKKEEDNALLKVQQTAGNRALGSMIQAKLKVSEPGDAYEQEADRVADHVMRMADPSPEAQVTSGLSTPHVQRMCSECDEEKEEKKKSDEESGTVQAKEVAGSSPPVPEAVESHLSSIRDGGQPLSESERDFFEPRFGQDFSQVRVHADRQANESAQSVNALAYTIGQHIVLGIGRYEPGTDKGRSLLAHELVHVVQQRRHGPRFGASQGQSRDIIDSRETKVALHTPPEMINRAFSSLGYTSWLSVFGGRYKLDHLVGSEEDWRSVLVDADNEETYRTHLQGFLELAVNPNIVNQKGHAYATEFENTITRAPSQPEILAFLKALYGLGDRLALAPNVFVNAFNLTKWPEDMRTNLRKFLEKYQGEWIQAVSETKPSKGSTVVGQSEVEAVASEGGISVSNSMINNGIHTAQEGVARLAFAHAKNDEQGKDFAQNIIMNSARVIRHALDVRNARLQEIREMSMIVLDVIFADILQVGKLGKLPGVAKLIEHWPTVISYLKIGAYGMAKSAMIHDDPDKQASSISKEFMDHAAKFGPNGDCPVLDGDAVAIAKNSFVSNINKS